MNRRRFFLGDTSKPYLVLSFIQDPDGSIYLFAPDGQDLMWMGIDENLGLVTQVSEHGEKLSVHGSGISHIKRRADGRACFRYDGMYLKNDERKLLGVRHIATAFLGKPSFVPNSPAGSRASDVILTREVLVPGVFVFFAVPLMRQRLAATIALPESDLPVKKEFQWGSFRMRYHQIVWCYYRTRHMSTWPWHTHVCALDGLHVPLIIGECNVKSRVDVRVPRIELTDEELWLRLV